MTDRKIGYLFLEPDPTVGVHYRPLHFQYVSYDNFINHKLHEILETTREIYSDKGGNERYYIQIYNIEKHFPTHSPVVYSLKNKGYSVNITFNVKLYKKTRVGEKTNVSVLLDYRGTNNSMINVPLLIGYGLSTGKEGSLYYPGEVGGGFLSVRSISKIGINLLEKPTQWPKLKRIKASHYTFSFSSISPAYIIPQITRYFKINLNLENPAEFTIGSFRTFITVNVLILVQYLLNISLSSIKQNLLNGVQETDVFLISLIHMIVDTCQQKIEQFSSTSKYTNAYDKVQDIITQAVQEEYDEQASKLTLEEFRANMFETFLPHVHNGSNANKGVYLLMIVKMFLFAIINPEQYPDRDSHAIRRIFTYGSYFEQIMSEEVEAFISKMKAEIKMNIEKKATNLINYMSMTTMGFNTSFNNLMAGRFKKSEGHIRTHPHYSWMQNITIPRSVAFYPDQVKIAKIFNCRQFHASQYGFFCPADIPDHGEHVGLITQLSIHSYITALKSSEYKTLYTQLVKQIYKKMGVDVNNPTTAARIFKFKTGVPLLIENDVLMFIATEDVEDVVSYIRQCKRNGVFCINDFGIALIDGYIKHIRINIGSGRVVRPILVLEDGELIMNKHQEEIEAFSGTWSEFIRTFPNVVEIVDIEQFIHSNVIENTAIYEKMNLEDRKKYQYCDFKNEFKVGYSASCLLGINHNAGPRSIFGCAQVKQSISCLTPDLLNRIDNGIHMIFPEIPSIVSMGVKTSHIAQNTFGQHLIVALMSMEGINQEDAIVVKRSFIENSGMSILSTKKVQLEIPNENFRASLPDNTQHSYKKFDQNGLPRINSILVANDAYAKNISSRIITSKVGNLNKDPIKSDISEPYTDLYPARVARIQIENSDKVKIRILTISNRSPIIGDKFTSRTSQKGTIAKIVDDDELPYLADGTRPDFVINSTSIYSRKTIAMLLEMFLTNAFINKPKTQEDKIRFINMPSFNDNSIESYLQFCQQCTKAAHPEKTESELRQEAFCEETMYNPDTHEPYKKKIMIGALYYLRLRHMTLDKINIRSRGKKTKLTKQPNEGRRRGGGIRFGEMERDCIVAHGAAFSLTDILKDSEEDRDTVRICSECSDIISQIKTDSSTFFRCDRCHKRKLSPPMHKTEVSHVVKVFKTQIAAQGIKIKFDTTPRPAVYYKPLTK